MAGSGLEFRHESRRLADFKHTPLLPHKHSQNGPGIAVGDLSGDGLDDVYVGSGRGQEKAVYLQTEPGRFVRRVLEDDTDFEDMGALFLDADGDGHLDLYVVSGGAFLTNNPGDYQDRLYLNDGQGNLRRAAQGLPELTASGSCVIAADYDRDGDLDLFVCGRITPGEYPTAPRSYLLRNDSRPGAPRFTDVTEQVAPGLTHPGLVTSALWTDFDQDGQVDLILAGEWMPITFFRNQQGRFTDVTASTGLGETSGWWNSLVAGDFNHDGQTDYLAGNLGLNSEYHASPREPLRLYAADFDQNGSVDPILSYFIQGKSYPAHSRDLMIDQIIAMKGRFKRYDDYAKATFEQVLSREERKAARMLESAELRTSYLENLGGGRFALRPLPLPAQLAPTFGMLVDDVDGDGNLDVLMVGNSHATETQTGWYTASIGCILFGNGDGSFRPVSGASSGFFVNGDAKGITELRLDDRRSLVLVTQNNDQLRVFSRTAASGSRVLRLQPSDAYAVLTLPGGRTRREEFYHGSTYLSQSSRYLTLPRAVERAVVYDLRGEARELQLH
ncbi:MAG: VCBS repeat-containing protein [Chloroflexota bacterium]|nr:VCBS repeat-containing protein [Chloroflexota bacterium]